MAASSTTGVDPASLRSLLERHAHRGETLTYQEVAAALGLQPPLTIKRVTTALESLMDEDARDGRPLLAAVVVSRTAPLPAPGFFARARRLGVYAGPESGPEAVAFHRQQLKAVRARAGKPAGDTTD